MTIWFSVGVYGFQSGPVDVVSGVLDHSHNRWAWLCWIVLPNVEVPFRDLVDLSGISWASHVPLLHRGSVWYHFEALYPRVHLMMQG